MPDLFRVTFDISDAADILIVAVVTYTALRILSADRRYFVLWVSVALAGTYFAAHTFDLFLTERLFNLGIIAWGLVLAIAFQDDIRRSISRFGSWRPFQARKPVGPDYVDTLAEFAFASAEKRIGALIVIKGGDSIEGDINRGIGLTAPVHLALLESIFDPHSPGHDGAVVVEDGQIKQMCAHLPLAAMTGERSLGGTRHSAAVGLSELCDAVVIAISEERGTVSIAQAGKLSELKSPTDMKHSLDPLRTPSLPVSNRRAYALRPFQNSGLKLAALAFATIGWFSLAAHADIVNRKFVVPIEYRNIPADLRLDAAAPDDVQLTLSGAEPAFDMLETKGLCVSIDLGRAAAGTVEISLDKSNCQHPADLQVVRVDPAVVQLTLIANKAEKG